MVKLWKAMLAIRSSFSLKRASVLTSPPPFNLPTSLTAPTRSCPTPGHRSAKLSPQYPESLSEPYILNRTSTYSFSILIPQRTRKRRKTRILQGDDSNLPLKSNKILKSLTPTNKKNLQKTFIDKSHPSI